MITKMLKATIFTIKSQQSSVLKNLRQLGVLHVELFKMPTSSDMPRLEDAISDIEKTIILLKPYSSVENVKEVQDISEIVEEVLMLDDERTELYRKQEIYIKQQEWFDAWGKVSLENLKYLMESGFYVKLYQAPRASMDKIDSSHEVFILAETKFDLKIALIARTEEERLDLKEEQLPETEYVEIVSELSKIKTELLKIEDDFAKMMTYKNLIEAYRKSTLKRLEYEKVKFGMEEAGMVTYLKGYVPTDKAASIKEYANANDCAYVLEEVTEEDDPPILIKNNKWINIIAPVFKFMGTVPNYNEFDISIWFLLFFGLFFAMLIGDAGYGVLFVVLTFLARKKFKDAPPEPFLLMYAMSAATIFWGAITGTWFGVEKIAQLPVFSSVVIPSIASFGAVDSKETIMHLCFLIGAVHLSIAHLLLAFRARKSLRALGQVGWVGVVWGLYFVAHLLVLSQPFPLIGKVSLVGGIILIILFANAQKNMFKGALLSLADIPLSAISTFSDVVSYVRLFAVGYASVVVAVSFNEMALGIGFNSVFTTLGAVFILLIGHGLNIVLGAMALIVHGVRLNMLEFSGHLNMEWAGKEYEPFKE